MYIICMYYFYVTSSNGPAGSSYSCYTPAFPASCTEPALKFQLLHAASLQRAQVTAVTRLLPQATLN